ncbi:MAG: glycosyltransferase family 4 protein [Alphaproteobacteria bacterium]|nr:glycosyltransferase family 4 protein [Alphaproteobacteria bacterium]
MAKHSNKVKMLMILNHMDWFWSHRLPLAQAIMDKGWDLHLAATHSTQDQKVKDIGLNPHELPVLGGALHLLSHFLLLWHLAKLIREVKPDMIHVITIRYAFYTGLVTRFMGYKPVIFTVAGLGSLYTAPGLKMKLLRGIVIPLLRFAFGGKDKFIIFQNPDDQAKMLETHIVTQDNSVIIRGSGVDIKKFAFQPYIDKSGELPIVLFASRLLREKGITDFIEAGEILKKRGVKVRMIVAGNIYPDNPRSLTQEEMDAAHASGAIEWVGQHDNMPELMARSKMMVLPSYYGEGVPKVLLEAAAIGRPIITCDAPGCRETVEHGVNGYLVPPQDPEILADTIEGLVQDTAKCQEFGKEGRARVEKDFNTDVVVQKTMDVYSRFL